jgi:serine/threonine protein kinase/TPR repeat protein
MNTPPNREVALFSAALELPASQRGAYLDEACADDPALRLRLEALLRDHEAAGAFLETPPPGAQGSPTGAEVPGATVRLSGAPAEKAGDRIGRYKLLQQIGEGGCGVVYMAEQEEPVRRRVALKVIKLGMDTKQVVARFEAERQALALMDHPNIAKVLDAGATDMGRPFFVMELVRGIKITDFCDENKVSTEDRLKLFIQVCQAIQHAHQKGIIHRDIKPSNILVADHDGVPVPKIIDFGIAKATTDQRLTDKTLFTAFEQFIGTPAYMSPEQAKLSGLDIDTRSDIYSLGVLLYELLTGKTPFEAKRLLNIGLDEIRRIIREEEPERPSTRLSTLTAADLTEVAKQRHAEPAKLSSLIRGDLDWIVMKALEKDRARRYETANGLAMDIERHLNCEPVVARPPSRLYEFQKTVRRHKLGFAAAAAVFASLLLGLGVSTWMFFQERGAKREQATLRQQAEEAQSNEARLRTRAEAGEQKANTEAAKSQQVARFLEDMLQSVGPSVAVGRDTTILQEILDKAAQRVGEELNEQPEVKADMRDTIGDVYFALGKYAVAETMLREAIEIRRKLSGNKNNLDLAQALDDLGVTLEAQSKADEAIELHREALAIRRKVLGDQHPAVAKSLSHLGNALSANHQETEAEVALRDAVAIQRKLLGNENLDLAESLTSLANSYSKNEHGDQAEPLSREALAIRRKLLGDRHPDVAASCQNLANILRRQNKYSEAESLYHEAIGLRGKVLGPNHPLTSQSRQNLYNLLNQEGKVAESVTLEREAANGGDAEAQGRLGWLYATGAGVRKDWAEAVGLCRKSSEQGNANGQFNLARFYDYGWGVERDFAEAAKWYRKAAEQGLMNGESCLGACYENGRGVEKNLAEAAKWYVKAAERGDLRAEIALGWYYEHGVGVQKDLAKAVRWRCKAAERGNVHVLNDAAWSLATSTEAGLRDGKAALQCAEKAVTMTQRQDEISLDSLAAASAETGAFSNAVLIEREAIQLCQNDVVKQAFLRRLRLYEANTPCREATLENKASDEKYFYNGGYFVKIATKSRGQWEEWMDTSDGHVKNFYESGRDSGVILLKDASRNMLLRIPIKGGMSQISTDNGAKWNDLYEVSELPVPFSAREAEIALKQAVLLGEQGKLAEAEAPCREAIALFKQLVEYDPKRSDPRIKLGHLQWQLGDTLLALGRRDEAEKVLSEALKVFANAVTNFPDVAFLHQEQGYSAWKLATMLESGGRLDAAEAEYRQAIALHEKASADFPDQAVFTERLGGLKGRLLEMLCRRGKLAEARSICQEAAELGGAPELNAFAWFLATCGDPNLRDETNAVVFAEKAVAATNRKNVSYLDTLAAAYAETGQFAKAISIQQEAIALSQSEPERKDLASHLKLYENHAPYRDHGSLAELTSARLREGKFAEAEVLARECLAIRERDIPDDWRTFNARSMLGGSLLGQKKYAEAEPLLLAGYEGMKQREVSIPPEGKPRLRETLERLVQLYEATHRPGQAAEWKQKLKLFSGEEAERKVAAKP